MSLGHIEGRQQLPSRNARVLVGVPWMSMRRWRCAAGGPMAVAATGTIGLLGICGGASMRRFARGVPATLRGDARVPASLRLLRLERIAMTDVRVGAMSWNMSDDSCFSGATSSTNDWPWWFLDTSSMRNETATRPRDMLGRMSGKSRRMPWFTTGLPDSYRSRTSSGTCSYTETSVSQSVTAVLYTGAIERAANVRRGPRSWRRAPPRARA